MERKKVGEGGSGKEGAGRREREQRGRNVKEEHCGAGESEEEVEGRRAKMGTRGMKGVHREETEDERVLASQNQSPSGSPSTKSPP